MRFATYLQGGHTGQMDWKWNWEQMAKSPKKAGNVARVFKQKEGVDYFETLRLPDIQDSTSTVS